MQNLAKEYPSSVYKEGAHFYKDKKKKPPAKKAEGVSPLRRTGL